MKDHRMEMKEIKKDISDRLKFPQFGKLSPLDLKDYTNQLEQKLQERKVRPK